MAPPAWIVSGPLAPVVQVQLPCQTAQRRPWELCQRPPITLMSCAWGYPPFDPTDASLIHSIFVPPCALHSTLLGVTEVAIHPRKHGKPSPTVICCTSLPSKVQRSPATEQSMPSPSRHLPANAPTVGGAGAFLVVARPTRVPVAGSVVKSTSRMASKKRATRDSRPEGLLVVNFSRADRNVSSPSGSGPFMVSHKACTNSGKCCSTRDRVTLMPGQSAPSKAVFRNSCICRSSAAGSLEATNRSKLVSSRTMSHKIPVAIRNAESPAKAVAISSSCPSPWEPCSAPSSSVWLPLAPSAESLLS
mmetsp:Transcript_45966/g.131659  ORF Transcript_45966/g.131659 Transcript_45966/m.131659 type:complete len:304 (+) Transcript_45966:752-1663(+)